MDQTASAADRAAITDVIYSVALAMDTRDWDLFTTCFTPEAQGDYAVARAGSRAAIIASTRGFLEPLDVTQHLVGNIQVTLDADTATTHATFIAQHVRAGGAGSGHYLIGGNYDDTLHRTDDGWKITNRRIRGIWSDGDASVLTTPVS